MTYYFIFYIGVLIQIYSVLTTRMPYDNPGLVWLTGVILTAIGIAGYLLHLPRYSLNNKSPLKKFLSLIFIFVGSIAGGIATGVFLEFAYLIIKENS